jgi:hypothetical protein
MDSPKEERVYHLIQTVVRRVRDESAPKKSTAKKSAAQR